MKASLERTKEGDDPEWAVRLEGPGSAPRQISVTGRGTKDVVYDASLGFERLKVWP